MIGHGERFRAICNVPREVLLHRKEVCPDAPVVVNEVLYSEFNSVCASEDDSKLLRYLPPVMAANISE